MVNLTELNLHEASKIGLMNLASGKLLTVENFNNEINISGTLLRKRQVWTILVSKTDTQENNNTCPIYIMSSFGKFLSSDRDGRVTCNSANIGPNEKFQFEYNLAEGNGGEFGIKSVTHGYYLTGNDCGVQCFSKTIKYWIPRLAMHPQMNLKHAMRNRYIRIRPDGKELRSDLDHPWGVESLIRLHQVPLPLSPVNSKKNQVYGHVAFCTDCSNYLNPDGSLTPSLSEENMFAMEMKPGYPTLFSFRHIKTGHYLSAIGPGTVKLKMSSQTTVTKEDYFIIERGTFQVSILGFNNKFVSIKQGMDVSANQNEIADTEIFQLDYLGPKEDSFDASSLIQTALDSTKESLDDSFESLKLNGTTKLVTNGHEDKPANTFLLSSGYWRLRSKNNTMITFKNSSAVQHSLDGGNDNEFEVFVLSNSEFPSGLILVNKSRQCVSAKRLGGVSCNNSPTTENYPKLNQEPLKEEIFRFYPVINRTSVIIRSSLTGAFISRSTTQSKVKIAGIPLECLRPTHESFVLKKFSRGTFQLFSIDDSEKDKPWLVWNVTEQGVYLQKSNIHDKEELEETLEEPTDLGTELAFVHLGQGRVLIRVISDGLPKTCFLRIEPKGEIKIDSSGNIAASWIWEL